MSVVMHPSDAEAVKCPVCGLYPVKFLLEPGKDGILESVLECKAGHQWRLKEIIKAQEGKANA